MANHAYDHFYFHRFKSGEVFGATVRVGVVHYHAIDSGWGWYNVCESTTGSGMRENFASIPKTDPLTAEAILQAVTDSGHNSALFRYSASSLGK